ncbi:MAG: hypothetical protein ABI613_11455 [Gemmatimonadota bacterium]
MKAIGWLTGAVILAAACSSPGEPDPRGDVLTIENRTPVAFVAFAHANGNLVDPVPALPPGSYDNNIIRPGRRLAFDSVYGYEPGLDAGLFLYRIAEDHSAVIAESRTIPASDILHNHGIVRITSLPRYSPRQETTKP